MTMALRNMRISTSLCEQNGDMLLHWWLLLLQSISNQIKRLKNDLKVKFFYQYVDFNNFFPCENILVVLLLDASC